MNPPLCGRDYVAASLFIVAILCAESLAVEYEAFSESGIEYANSHGHALTLDMSRPAHEDGPAKGPFPVIVCIHGGGFRAGDSKAYDALCDKLAKHGYVAVTINYRLAPESPFPAAVHDCKAAVRWLRANANKYDIDGEQIGVMGGSAGGTLAEFLGVTNDQRQFEGDGGNSDLSSRVACVVSFFGASDFTKSYGKSKDAHEVLPLYFGGNLETARDKHVEGSPLTWVSKNSVPTLCVHGTNDNYVALEQSEFIIEKLKAAGVEASLLVMPDAGHGFKGKDQEKAEDAMIKFFDDHLKK